LFKKGNAPHPAAGSASRGGVGLFFERLSSQLRREGWRIHAILADTEELPSVTDQVVFCTNIRRRDGKDVHYADAQAVSFMIPWHRINFLEIIGGEEEGEIIGFVREK
jgi:hypothetical protein